MADPQRILLIQLKRAGDVIVTTPVIAALKKRFPLAEIDFLVEKPFAPLLEHNPGLTRIRIYDKSDVWGVWKRIRQHRYQWILDFQSSPRSALLCLFSKASITAGYRVPFWGLVYEKTVPRPGGNLSVVQGKFTLVERIAGRIAFEEHRHITLKPEERRWAETNLAAEAPPVGLIPTHRHPIRRWSRESYVALAQRLRERGRTVWWFWGPGEESYVQALVNQVPGSVMIPRTSLRQMAALLARCACVITNDNGPMHLATAVGTPTVTIYGPTEPTCWNPGGPRHRALTADNLRCLGCNFNTCPFDHECMTLVTPDAVLWTMDDLERTVAR